MKEVFDFLKQLTLGMPSYMRGGILVFITICVSLYFMGFDVDTIRKIRQQHEITESSIKLSNRIKRDDSDILNTVSHEIFEDIHDIQGVAIFEMSPTLSPRVIKVVTRDGNSDFKDFFKVGRKFHIGSTLPKMYSYNREGFRYVDDTDDHYWLKDIIKCESVVSVSIMYRNICVGNIMVFLDKKLNKYDEKDLDYIIGNISNQSVNIVEQLYYK